MKRDIFIERGIPCPGPKGPRTPGGTAAKNMVIGDSAFFQDKCDWETARKAIWSVGGKSVTRKRVEDGVKGWRLWRTA